MRKAPCRVWRKFSGFGFNRSEEQSPFVIMGRRPLKSREGYHSLLVSSGLEQHESQHV